MTKINVRCRVTKCEHFNKRNSCVRSEIVIDSEGKCLCKAENIPEKVKP